MASDVEDLITFYQNLPSIFENNSSSSLEQSHNTVVTDVTEEKSYQPMSGSFLFADSDPLSRAAFIVSSSSSTETETEARQERRMDDEQINSSSNQTASSPLAPVEDIDHDNDDEDDFDGIPIRHASMTLKPKLNGDSDSILHHAADDQLFEEFVHRLDNSHDDNDLEDDSFLNGFTDEHADTTAIVPSLFKDIPDIDDPNGHEEDDNDDDGRVPFDCMDDMFDQSDSIRSSSPDSLLSSSHLRDEDDDDDDNDMGTDDEVAQWNDDNILHTTSSNLNSQLNPPLVLNIHPFDQVDFIDSSRSNSRGSNVSSHLSVGYADQAHVFMSDDELETSFDSEDNHDNEIDNHRDIMDVDCDTFDRDDSEELCLQVNLDDRRSPSSLSKSSSIRSSPIPDETPIGNIDEDNDESNTLQVAPIAALDDEGDDSDNDDNLQPFISDGPVFPLLTSTIKNPIELKHDKRQNDIVQDIVHMRHLLDENDRDDEFVAVMHNPKLFEQVLYNNNNNSNGNHDDDDDQKESNLIKRTNSVTRTFRPSSQLSIDNKIEKESSKHLENILHANSLIELNNEKTPSTSSSSSQYTRKTTTNNFSPTAVIHLPQEEKPPDTSVSIADTINILDTKQQASTSDISSKPNTFRAKNYQRMSTDNDSDDDLELLKTLSQFHGIINTTSSSNDVNQVKSQLSSCPLSNSQEKNSLDLSSEKIRINGNEIDSLNEKSPNTSLIKPSSSHDIDTIIKTDDEKEEKSEQKNVIFYKNLPEENNNGKQKEKYVRREEKNDPTTFFSLTSLTSPILFNDDSHFTVVTDDPDASSSLPNFLLGPNKLDDSTLFSNRLITDDLQISNTTSNMSNLPTNDLSEQTTTNLFDPFAPTNMTTTTTTTTITTPTAEMFNDISTTTKDSDKQSTFSPSNSTPTQPLANYNFDDLWNQSISHITSSNNHELQTNNDVDPNTFAWNAFLNDNENTSHHPTANITWNSLFDRKEEEEEEQNDLKEYLHWIISHLDDVQPSVTFISTKNLESIMQDIHMCAVPFEPIPSPPLHVDHTVANPMINAIHHELFPIDELEQTNMTQGQPSMILYEEDEEENQKLAPLNNILEPLAENVASKILQTAVTEVNEPYQPVEHLVDQILAQAIYEVYNEDQTLPTEHLASIISWHDHTKATHEQLLDPFDQKFDSVWSNHFEAPDTNIQENLFANEEKENVDPWLTTTTEVNHNPEPLMFFSQSFDKSDLFSTTINSAPNVQDTNELNEYLPPPSSVTNPSSTISATTNSMKYTFTAPVIDESDDENSNLDDYLTARKDNALVTPKTNANDEPIETTDVIMREHDDIERNKHESFFSNNARLSQFEAFASDQPLNSPDVESKFVDMNNQFENELNNYSQVQQSTDDNAPWVSLEKMSETGQSSGIGESEPWELEDAGEEKMTPVPTTIRLSGIQ